MTGTKVVKINLEGTGVPGSLPDLRLSGPSAEEVINACGGMEEIHTAKYDSMLEKTAGFDVNSHQLQRIVDVACGMCEDDDAMNRVGLLLTALVQNSKSNEFTITPPKLLDHIGSRLDGGKKIVINGDAGHFAGDEMIEGIVHIKGNTLNMAGQGMEGGRLIVDGSTGDELGEYMLGGEIHVKGNAGKNTCEKMSGGIITIDRNVGANAGWLMKGGSIHVKGDAIEGVGACMEGGSIKVGGNTGDNAGWEMEGGTLHIKGNAGDNVGLRMTGGKIRVNGRIRSISENYAGGEIWEGRTQVKP
ncbi:MAG: hypothetical protein V1921_06305 [Candidatus Altiarchaeota archaeon]